MRRRVVPFFYQRENFDRELTSADRAVFACSVMVTLVWTAMLVWIACQMGGLLAHFVTHVWAPPLPLRASLPGAMTPDAPVHGLGRAMILLFLRL